MCLIILWYSQNIVKHFFKVFSKSFLNCSWIVLIVLKFRSFATALLSYHRVCGLSTTFFKYFWSLLLNGEGGIWTLAPLLTTYSLSRGAPSAAWVLLQIAKRINHIKGTTVYQIFQTESVGFEPTVPFGITGFQDQLLKPLGQLSEQCFVILPLSAKYVKHFF